MNILSFITIVLVSLLAVTPAKADIFFGTGMSRFGTEVDGMWYQSEYPHDLNMTVPSAKIGWENESFRVGYIFTGKVTSNALAKTSDEAYQQHTPWPLSQWYGTGQSEGIFVEKKFGIYRAIYGTLGAMVYRSTWDVEVPDCIDYLGAKPRHFSHHSRPWWGVLPSGSVSVVSGSNAIELSYIPTRNYNKKAAPIYRNYAVNLSIIHKFK